MQYCYEHLSREVEDLEKEFPNSEEVKTFVSTLVPLLSQAMNLRTQDLSDKEFYRQASRVKSQILVVVNSPTKHPGIQHIQDIFREHTDRMYHWAANRRVPAENNLAERDLRPTVIARKVSFGSASDTRLKATGLFPWLTSKTTYDYIGYLYSHS
ncbi:MAG: transposase [bacterium]